MDRKAKFSELVELMAGLRAPGGCPWDREQTPRTIKHNILEEACEVIDAIDSGDPREIKEELGDLMLQVVFQAQMAAEAGDFSIGDVIGGIIAKLIRRHPHIFGDMRLETADEVLVNWERIKTEEKDGFSHLGNVPKSLPALAMSRKLQKKAAKIGFDWPDSGGALDKLGEEVSELIEAKSKSREEIEEEFGDILFTLVNIGNRLGVDAETSLRTTANKFRRRFELMEKLAKDKETPLEEMNLGEMDSLWNEAKNRLK